MNTENRFRMIGVLALAGLVSYAIYGGTDIVSDDADVSAVELSVTDNS